MDKQEELEKRIAAMENELAKYKGFIGGIVLVCSGVIAFVAFILEYLKR